MKDKSNGLKYRLRYQTLKIRFFKSCYVDHFCCGKGHHSYYSVSTGKPCDTTTYEYDKTLQSRKVFMDNLISVRLKQVRFLSRSYSILLLSHFASPSSYAALLVYPSLTHFTCIFMWMDVPRADYTTRWDHVLYLIPRACII